MILQDLPVEILFQVFEYLGSTYFHDNYRRLVLSKWWYSIARPVMLNDLDLSAQSLERFVAESDQETMMDLMQLHVSKVTISLDGVETWHPASVTPVTLDAPDVDRRYVERWTLDLNQNLDLFAKALQKCPRVRHLTFEALPERQKRHMGSPRREYLNAYPIASLLPLQNLTSLEIDTCGSMFVRQTDAPHSHVCHSISTMLPRLKRLRCRMTNICPHIFDVPKGSPPLDLEYVIINLSLLEVIVTTSTFRYPGRCYEVADDTHSKLQADMEAKAQQLAARMRNPKLCRVLSHTFPWAELISFDAITGRKMLLKRGAAWDADGREVKVQPLLAYLAEHFG